METWNWTDDLADVRGKVNGNFASVTDALAGLNTALAGKAEGTALAALQTAVGGKAEQSALAAARTALEGSIEQVRLLAAGKPELVMGQYTGQVADSRDTVQTIELGFSPQAVLLIPYDGGFCASSGRNYGALFGPGLPAQSGSSADSWVGQVTDSGFQVRNDSFTLLNTTNHTYTYLALK